jgi:hypothetical protein
MSAHGEEPAKSVHDAGRSGKLRKRFSQFGIRFADQWLLGRQLTELDNWKSTERKRRQQAEAKLSEQTAAKVTEYVEVRLREQTGTVLSGYIETELSEPVERKLRELATLDRLDWSIKWHTLANRQAQRWYTVIKVVEILAAASIPVLAATGGNSFATKGSIAGLGALVVVLEGIQQLKKYAQNALLWGQGKEALKREYYLYEARAGLYGNVDDPDKVLANRIEQIIGREVTQWAGQIGRKDNSGADARQRPGT